MRASRPRWPAALGTSLLLALAAAWLLIGDALGYRALQVEAELSAAARPWRGAVHVHSDLSGDAQGTVEEIAGAAAAAGLDFVLVTEHTRSAGAEGLPREGWHDDVLVVVGEEISTTAGHLLALGTAGHRFALGPTPRQAVDDIVELGGAAIVAHPAGGELAWSDSWAGIAGIEVLNFAGAVNRLSRPQQILGIGRYLLSPASAAAAAFAVRAPGIDLWDRMTRLRDNPGARPLAAVGAVDAHGPLGSLRIPSYAATLGALSMLVWADAAPRPGESARRQASAIERALVAGRSAVMLDAAGTATGFTFAAVHDDHGTAAPGDVERWEPGWRMRADLGGPGEYRVLLLADGEVVAQADGGPVEAPAAAAATYRVEVYRLAGSLAAEVTAGTPWIVSNPIYLWTEEAIAGSRHHRAPRLPAPTADTDLFSEPGWAAESDDASHSALALVDGGLRWDLRVPAAEGGQPYSAVAWRPERAVDWSGATGVAIQLTATDPWRVGLRLEIERGGGVEVWERVVPAGPGSRGVGVRWADFRAIDPAGGYATSRRLSGSALSRVRALVLVVTPDLMKPRTEARIDVLRLGPFGTR